MYVVGKNLFSLHIVLASHHLYLYLHSIHYLPSVRMPILSHSSLLAFFLSAMIWILESFYHCHRVLCQAAFVCLLKAYLSCRLGQLAQRRERKDCPLCRIRQQGRRGGVDRSCEVGKGIDVRRSGPLCRLGVRLRPL